MSNLGNLSSRAIIGEYFRQLEQGPVGWVPQVGSYFRSDQPSEDYRWLGMSPAMREWVGGRHAKGLRDQNYVIRNKPYESTLEISVDDLRRDKTGQIMTRVADQVQRANAHWAKLLSAAIVAGESTACYDGQLFFDTDHSEGDSGTQSNDLSVDISALPTTNHGSTTAPAPAELAHCIMQAHQAIIGFVDDQGEPMNENASEFVVMVPTSLHMQSMTAVGARMLDGGDDNPIAIGSLDGLRFRIVSNARLDSSWTAQFAVFRADSNVKPFILQEEVPVEVSAIAEGSELEFRERVHHYGLYASRAVGYGYWQHACLVTMT